MRHPATSVASTLMRTFRLPLAGFIGIIAILFLVGGPIVGAVSGVEHSTWETAGAGGIKYFPMAMTIMLTGVFVPIYVAHGVTRRQFTYGATLFIAGWSVLLGVVMFAGFVLEAVVYAAADWPQRLDLPHLYTSWQQAHLVITEYALLAAIHMATGWVIGTTYYRLGWFKATLLLPASLLPVVGVEVLLATSWVGEELGAGAAFPLPLAVAIPASLAVIALALVVNFVFVRHLPIKLGSP